MNLISNLITPTSNHNKLLPDYLRVFFQKPYYKLIYLIHSFSGKPKKSYFGFDKMVGDTVQHPTTLIRTYGSPKLVPGKINKALQLTGRLQKAEFEHMDGTCLGDLDNCHHGVLLALWLRLDKMEEGMYYLSSGINGITISYVDRKLRIKAATSTREWTLTSPEVDSNKWHYTEISWDPEIGLRLYMDNDLIKEEKNWKGKMSFDYIMCCLTLYNFLNCLYTVDIRK